MVQKGLTEMPKSGRVHAPLPPAPTVLPQAQITVPAMLNALFPDIDFGSLLSFPIYVPKQTQQILYVVNTYNLG